MAFCNEYLGLKDNSHTCGDVDVLCFNEGAGSTP